MQNKDRIDVLIKMYAHLRHEVNVRTDATKNYGWPVIVALITISLGLFKKEDFGILIPYFPLLVPLVGMTILALDANATEAMDRARIKMAEIEDKINELESSEKNIPLINIELERKNIWQLNKSCFYTTTVTWILVYILLCLFFIHNKIDWDWNSYTAAFTLVLVTPVSWYGFNRCLIGKHRYAK